MQLKQREHGEEQPYWPAGPFKIRLPFIHYRWEMAEMIQGLIMFVVSLAMIPLLEQYLGLPYDVALAFVVVCGIGFMLRHYWAFQWCQGGLRLRCRSCWFS